MASNLLTKEDIALMIRMMVSEGPNQIPLKDEPFIVSSFEVAHVRSGHKLELSTADLVNSSQYFKAFILRPFLERIVEDAKLTPKIRDLGAEAGMEPLNMGTSESLLEERGKTHGDYTIMATRIQELKSVMRRGTNWGEMSTTKLESLELIATKIGRIIEGDSDCVDHWDDIIGYAKLARDRIPHKKG